MRRRYKRKNKADRNKYHAKNTSSKILRFESLYEVDQRHSQVLREIGLLNPDVLLDPVLSADEHRRTGKEDGTNHNG